MKRIKKTSFFWLKTEVDKERDKGYTFASKAGWYNSKRWKNLRLFILTQDVICKMCWDRKKIITEATVLDHINPVTENTTEEEFYDINNLQTLCDTCHRVKTREDDYREKLEEKLKKGKNLQDNLEIP